MTLRLALALVLVPLVAISAPAKPRIVVNRPVGEKITDGVIGLLDGLILAEVQRSGRFSAVIGSSDVQQLVDHEAQKQICGSQSDSCLAELGGALDAQFLLASTIGQLGSKYVVNVRLIDVKAANVVERRSEQLPATEDALGIAVPRIVASMFPDASSSAGPWIALGTSAAAAAVYAVLLSGAIDAARAGDVPGAELRATGANVSAGIAGVALTAGLGWWLLW